MIHWLLAVLTLLASLPVAARAPGPDIHAFGWQREQAIDYLVDNAGIARDFAAAEVDRYIVQPGQALGYKITLIASASTSARPAPSRGTP